ncbi:phage tail tape measure protein [Ruminococcus sp. RTP21358st1_A5_RTP21358_211008]|jgi:TP901 family phage tail tape measure protein|uniref:phage tail tape measure protein n=1 Tax=unclassified Ruminococcus TaxID=2608920 RepID=UPI0020614149|nr:MAG TPA: minor tail protein [Caudoviricetes sp.]
MAGNRIKGITVEIGGDTTKLQTALKGVNTEIRNTQSQLRDVEKLLKLDPGNTELIAQKHRLLAQAVSETREKLETLKTAQRQADEALRNGTISQQQYDGLQREIVETEQELRRLEQQAEQSATALQKIGATGEKLQAVGDKVSSVGQKLLPVTGVVTGLGTAAVKTAADFDSAMSRVAAVSGATGSDFDKLRDKAREMGAKTKFSATEAADAMNYMAMAGWKTEDMLSGIEGIMYLAAASGEDLATTSDIVTDALTAFGLTAEDSGHFADVLAAASSNANTNVSMMGETFKYCAPVAGALGFSVEDTAEAIGLMGNAGIKASQAGTSMRSIMTNLTGDVKLSGAAIGDVTIATTNADGSMRSLSAILADCRVAFGGMTEAEKANNAETLVGKNAMSGFLALMNAAPEDIAKVSGAVNNCKDAAKNMADTMQDNLEGQLTILKSQLQELAISFGDLLMPAVRSIVSGLQGMVDVLNAMPDGVKQVIMIIALLAAVLGPVLIIIGKVISAVGTIMTIVPKLAGVINTVKTAFGALNAVMLANPIAIVIAAIAALVAAFVYLWNTNEEFRQFWISLWESVKETAIQCWQAISAFLSQAWEAIQNTAVSVWNGIRDFFSGLWTGIQTLFTTVVNAIAGFLSGAWNAVKGTVVSVWNAISQFFTSVWNGIRNVTSVVVNGIRSFLQSAWNGIRALITTVMNGIKSVVTAVWNGIRSVITRVMNGIRSVVSSVWSGIRNTISSIVNGIKNTVSNAFHAMWSGIRSTISGIYNTIRDGLGNAVNYITSLASAGWRWGADIINGIVNGIRSCIGAVASAVTDVANTIRSHLHFSVPDEGPLTDFESWMPDFMNGLAEGIEKSRGMVKAAVNSVAADMVVSPQMAMADSGVMTGTGPSGGADLTAGIVAALKDVLGDQKGQQGDLVIPVYLGNQLLDEVIVTAQQRMSLRSGGR